MALQPASAGTGPNANAWRLSLVSAGVLWVVTAVFLVALQTPYAALTCIGPLALAAGLVAILARHLRIRLPVAIYPVLVLAIAALVNAPIIDLLLL
jgi:hypothetical protein